MADRRAWGRHGRGWFLATMVGAGQRSGVEPLEAIMALRQIHGTANQIFPAPLSMIGPQVG